MKKISFFCIAGLVLLNGTSLAGKRKKQPVNFSSKKTSPIKAEDHCQNYCFIAGTIAFNFLTSVLAFQATQEPHYIQTTLHQYNRTQ